MTLLPSKRESSLRAPTTEEILLGLGLGPVDGLAQCPECYQDTLSWADDRVSCASGCRPRAIVEHLDRLARIASTTSMSIAARQWAEQLRRAERHAAEPPLLTLSEAALLETEPLLEPISTGLPQLDDQLGGGLYPESIYVVVGATGRGKTAFGIQTASHISLRRPVGYVSTELRSRQLIARAAAPIMDRPWRDLWRHMHQERAEVARVLADRRIIPIDGTRTRDLDLRREDRYFKGRFFRSCVGPIRSSLSTPGLASLPSMPPSGGHWWVEIENDDGTVESYGWWPKHPFIRQAGQGSSATLWDVVTGTDGELNAQSYKGDRAGTPTNDPHQGDPADTAFNPKLSPDSPYTSCSAAAAAIREFAQRFQGGWSYPFGWNCHSFQEEMMSKIGLDQTNINKGLSAP